MLDLKMWPVTSALGRKMKAVKSCLVCLASFCEKHLQPHYDSLAFRKHKLVEVPAKPQQNIRSRHDEMRKILRDKYKKDLAAAERTDEQKEVKVSRQQVREKDVKLLRQQVGAVRVSADNVEHSKAAPPSSVNKAVKNRPLSVPTPPDPAPAPGCAVSSDMKKLQQREKIIKYFDKDKPAPVITSGSSKVCGKCGEALSSTQTALKALDKVFHASCFCCMSCCRPLQGLPFYDREGSPQCERCYKNSLPACSRCGEKITDCLLKAMGRCFHPRCFLCSTCSCKLEGGPFVAGEDNQPYCVQDYHRRFSPLCESCKEPIIPAPGSEEMVKVVALDKNFHVKCYRCEDCARPLSLEGDKCSGYPLDGRILCIKCCSKRTKQ
ncbi:zyxin [Fundulus heteroclitus]|uniref:zyxin n=1 Tax=Fundulus heteroclitus TaxID=8078 RepID=UPI00165A29D3|nr:zyxin [Fundulus heteroclitus]